MCRHNGTSPAVYRIFNTGSQAFKVYAANPNGTSSTPVSDVINEDQSRDLVTPGNKLLLIKPEPITSTNHIEGIYDLVKEVS